MPPSAVQAASTMSITPRSELTSVATHSARTPWLRMSSRAFGRAVLLATTMSTPSFASASATPSPMPLPPPVISARAPRMPASTRAPLRKCCRTTIGLLYSATWRLERMTDARTQPLSEEEVRSQATSCSNIGRWGPDDELGTLHFVTTEKVCAALSLVRVGEVVPLGKELVYRNSRHDPPSA